MSPKGWLGLVTFNGSFLHPLGLGLLLHQDLVVEEWPTSHQPLNKLCLGGNGGAVGREYSIKTACGAVAADIRKHSCI